MKTLRLALHGGIAVSAELSLRHGTTAAQLLEQAEYLRSSVDAVQVADNAQPWVQMSPLAAAALLTESGFDVIAQLTCRDRNRIALHSDLLGLQAMGVRNLVLNKGNQVVARDRLQAKPVFDVSCRELVAMAAAIGEKSAEERQSDAGFLIGTGARVFAAPPQWDAEIMLARSSAGAHFLQTQLCFKPAMLQIYMQRLVAARITWRYAVIVSLAPLPSAATARWLRENHRSVLIPEGLVKRLEAAPDPVQEGIAVCAQLMREFAAIPGVSGFNLHTLGNPAAVVAAIAASGLRPTTIPYTGRPA